MFSLPILEKVYYLFLLRFNQQFRLITIISFVFSEVEPKKIKAFSDMSNFRLFFR